MKTKRDIKRRLDKMLISFIKNNVNTEDQRNILDALSIASDRFKNFENLCCNYDWGINFELATSEVDK